MQTENTLRWWPKQPADPHHCQTCVGKGHTRRGRHRAPSLSPASGHWGGASGCRSFQNNLSSPGGAGEGALNLPEPAPSPPLLLHRERSGRTAVGRANQKRPSPWDPPPKQSALKTHETHSLDGAAGRRATPGHAESPRTRTFPPPVAASGSGRQIGQRPRLARPPRAAAHHPVPAPRPTLPATSRRLG